MSPQLISVAVLAGLLACRDRVSVDDHTGETAVHTGETGALQPVERICNDDYLDVADLPEPAVNPDDPRQLYRVVQVPSDHFDEAYLLVVFPSDPEQSLYEDGAPVVVVAVPALRLHDEPVSQLVADYGAIEIQPIYPGWSVDGVGTSGEPGEGGEVDAAMMREAIRFGAGLTTTVDGFTLGQVVEAPVCNDKVVVLGASSGGSVAMQALADADDALASGVLGLANHECPLLPQLILGDAGAPWMDPRDVANVFDEDGDGLTYDEGLNPLYRPGDCQGDSCALDYSALRWDPDTDPNVFYDWRWVGNTRTGLFYLDLDGDHQLTHVLGELDVDEDGVLDPDEDFVFLPHWDPGLPENPQIYSIELLEAAVELGVLDQDDWPVQLGTLEAARDFWRPRNMMTHIDAVAASAPPWFRVAIAYTAIDHGLALPDRPHITLFYDSFAATEIPIRYNFTEAMLECVVDRAMWHADWHGDELPYNYDLPLDELDDHAMGELIDNEVVKGLPALGLLWDMYGAFERCPMISIESATRAAPRH